MRGRKPKPACLKRLQGNPGHRKVPTEPTLPDTLPTCPRHVSGAGRREWRRLAKALHAAGILKSTDRAALAAYCQSYGRWVEAERRVAADGMVITTTAGNVVQNPYLAVANRALAIMSRYGAELGLSPSSRTRLAIAPPQPEDPFDTYVRQQLEQAAEREA